MTLRCIDNKAMLRLEFLSLIRHAATHMCILREALPQGVGSERAGLSQIKKFLFAIFFLSDLQIIKNHL